MASLPAWAEPHQRAVAAGEKFYKDPDTGLMVMTEIIHRQRGKCCGSGCRHCPYSHERVPVSKRAQLIKQPAWLVTPQWVTRIQCDRGSSGEGQVSQSGTTAVGDGFNVVVLFWSTGKDSFLAYRALCRAATGTQTEADPRIPVEVGTSVVLLTTFDAETRDIAHQDTNISDALAQAQALGAPLIGVPLPRGGDKDGASGGYIEVVQSALSMIRNDVTPLGGQLAGLAFGDLHLMHVRTWREAAGLQRENEQLIFPLWKRSEEDMMHELETCGVPCMVSSVAEEGKGVVEVGEMFTRELWQRARDAGRDGFGENGEFHTLAKVWEGPMAKPRAHALEW